MEITLINILKLLEDESKNHWAQERLKKLFVLELKFNLLLLDTTKWKGVDDKFNIEICKRLRVDAAKAIYSFTDNTLLNTIYKRVQQFKSESKEEFRSDSRIVSLINRIDVLATISELPDSVRDQSKTKYNIRIRNLRKIIIEILKDIK